MIAKVDRKWRKKHPNQHKRFGEKRERDLKKIFSQN